MPGESGLTPYQAVRVFSVETGRHCQSRPSESSMRQARDFDRVRLHQWLTTNSVELMAEQGHEFSQGV